MAFKQRNIKHKKRIPCPRLTMKHKEKRLQYARQYQTMNAKEWRKVFLEGKKFSLNDPDMVFRSTGTQKIPRRG